MAPVLQRSSAPVAPTLQQHLSPCQYAAAAPCLSNDHSSESSLSFSDLDLSTPISLASPTDVTLWDPTIAAIDPSTLFLEKDMACRPQPRFEYVDCGCMRPHIQVSATAGPREYRNQQSQDPGPDAFAPNPYASTLRVDRMCIAQAVWANCAHIGITEAMFCDDESISPFFRPCGKAIDDGGLGGGSDAVVRTIQDIFKTLKPDLRPLKEQITVKHHPLIDVLPFPTLRKNLIEGGNAFVEEELYYDLLNGLVCWGGAGISSRDKRDSSSASISTGTPWDCRSWEARIWFVQKYWELLGGEEGELVRQSEWWRNMRGDETDLWLGL